MEQIASGGGREFHLRTMEPGDEVGAPFGGEPYAALVWAARRTRPAQKQRIAEALIAGGCRYVVCGGMESGAWEDAADFAYEARDVTDPDAFVMTSSHRGEPEDEVAFFLVHSTSTNARPLTRHLVLLIGDAPAARERLVAAIREEVPA